MKYFIVGAVNGMSEEELLYQTLELYCNNFAPSGISSGADNQRSLPASLNSPSDTALSFSVFIFCVVIEFAYVDLITPNSVNLSIIGWLVRLYHILFWFASAVGASLLAFI